jgi:hypothetical protein
VLNTTSSEGGLLEKRSLIGHIMVDLGHIKPEHVDEALRKQEAYPVLKLGEILLAMLVLTPEQLEEGLQIQERMRMQEKEGF